MDEIKFQIMLGELEDKVEFNKLYNYKKFRQLTLNYELTKAETNELKNHFNLKVRNQRWMHKERFEAEKYWWREASGCYRLSKEIKERLCSRAWRYINNLFLYKDEAKEEEVLEPYWNEEGSDT